MGDVFYLNRHTQVDMLIQTTCVKIAEIICAGIAVIAAARKIVAASLRVTEVIGAGIAIVAADGRKDAIAIQAGILGTRVLVFTQNEGVVAAEGGVAEVERARVAIIAVLGDEFAGSCCR